MANRANDLQDKSKGPEHTISRKVLSRYLMNGLFL